MMRKKYSTTYFNLRLLLLTLKETSLLLHFYDYTAPIMSKYSPISLDIKKIENL